MERLERFFGAGNNPPTTTEVTRALWGACRGGQQAAAEYLLARGADLNWIPDWEDVSPLDAAERSGAGALAEWLRARGAKPAQRLNAREPD
jgi:ankyrin repeat protein